MSGKILALDLYNDSYKACLYDNSNGSSSFFEGRGYTQENLINKNSIGAIVHMIGQAALQAKQAFEFTCQQIASPELIESGFDEAEGKWIQAQKKLQDLVGDSGFEVYTQELTDEDVDREKTGIWSGE